FRELVIVGSKFAADDLVGLLHVLLRSIDQMDQNASALDVAEEAVSYPGTFMGALDQTGNIGQNEVALADPDDAEVGVKCRERVVGDLGLGRGYRREKGGFAGVRQTDKPGVGNQLQPKPNPLFGAFLSRVCVSRRLVGRGLEVGVAEAAIAARQ